MRHAWFPNEFINDKILKVGINIIIIVPYIDVPIKIVKVSA